MMMTGTRMALAGLALLISAGFTQAEDDPKAREIVERAIKASGGAKTLKNQVRLDIEDKGTFYGMGEGVPYEGRFTFHWPDRFRMEIVNAFTIINTPKGVWVESMGNVMEVTGDPLKYSRQESEGAYITSLIPLIKPNPKYKLSLFGKEEVAGEACDGVNVARKDGPVITMFFSQKTGLMLKYQTTVHSAEKGYEEVAEQTLYSDFKKVDGVMMPMKATILRDGEKYVESESTSVKFPKELDESLFEKPKAKDE